MREQKTIYTVIRMSTEELFEGIEATTAHTYSYRTSNTEKIKEYARKIQKSFPNEKVYVVSKEKAREIEDKCYELHRQAKKKAFARLEKNSKKIIEKQAVCEAFGM